MASTTESVAKAAVDIAGYPLRQQRGMYLRVVDMLQTLTGYQSAGNYQLSTTTQKLAQTAIFTMISCLVLSLPGERFKTGGMFDWRRRGYSRGSKKNMGAEERKMTRGASVFFDSDDFRKASAEAEAAPSSSIWNSYGDAMAASPLATKAVTASVISTLGDLLGQYLRTRQGRRELLHKVMQSATKGRNGSKANLAVLSEALHQGTRYDLFPLHNPRQTVAFAAYGLLLSGPLPHCWYAWLERAVPTPAGEEASTALTVKKLLLDRLLFAPPFVMATMLALNVFNGSSLAQSLATARETFAATLIANWKVWTPAQVFNFLLIPPQWRVLFANVVGFGWNTALSANLSVNA